MKYVTLADLAKTVRTNIRKVPHDIDFVIGVPRSGVLAGSMIAEFLNVPLIDVDSFCFGAAPTGGRRVAYHTNSGREIPKALVVDDTIFNGGSMKATRAKLGPFRGDVDFIFMAVYLEGPCTDVDIWLEDLRGCIGSDCPFVLYEWNIFHHTPRIMSRCLYDIDGVLCAEPPDERTGKEYVDYIKNAAPLFIPSVHIGGLVSYRLQKYEDITKAWLMENGVKYGSLTMFPADSWEEREKSMLSSSEFKAGIYGDSGAMLFVESSEWQARNIHMITGKPVYCVDSNKMFS